MGEAYSLLDRITVQFLLLMPMEELQLMQRTAVRFNFLSSYINGNVETVGDDSHIIVGIKNGRSPFSSSGRIGQWDGDAIGHVDVNLNTDSSGQWNGDFKSDGIVTIGQGTWNGNIDKDEGDVTVYSQGTWNGGFTASGKTFSDGKVRME